MRNAGILTHGKQCKALHVKCRQIWHDDHWFYKTGHAFLITNELYFFGLMADSGYVPLAQRVDDYTLRTKYLGEQLASWQSVTNPDILLSHLEPILRTLQDKGIRHGDLTKSNLFVIENKPILIDFAESRLWHDPRKDKRDKGDRFWLNNALRQICRHSITHAQNSIGR